MMKHWAPLKFTLGLREAQTWVWGANGKRFNPIGSEYRAEKWEPVFGKSDAPTITQIID